MTAFWKVHRLQPWETEGWTYPHVVGSPVLTLYGLSVHGGQWSAAHHLFKHTYRRFCTAIRTRFSSTSASAEIFWICLNPSIQGRICRQEQTGQKHLVSLTFLCAYRHQEDAAERAATCWVVRSHCDLIKWSLHWVKTGTSYSWTIGGSFLSWISFKCMVLDSSETDATKPSTLHSQALTALFVPTFVNHVLRSVFSLLKDMISFDYYCLNLSLFIHH